MRLLIRQSQVDEMIDESTELVKNQVCVCFQLFLLLLFFRLDQAF